MIHSRLRAFPPPPPAPPAAPGSRTGWPCGKDAGVPPGRPLGEPGDRQHPSSPRPPAGGRSAGEVSLAAAPGARGAHARAGGRGARAWLPRGRGRAASGSPARRAPPRTRDRRGDPGSSTGGGGGTVPGPRSHSPENARPPAVALGCLRARRSAALGCLRPLGSALGSGPRPLRRGHFSAAPWPRARPARAHAGHQVRGGRRRVSARGVARAGAGAAGLAGLAAGGCGRAEGAVGRGPGSRARPPAGPTCCSRTRPGRRRGACLGERGAGCRVRAAPGLHLSPPLAPARAHALPRSPPPRPSSRSPRSPRIRHAGTPGPLPWHGAPWAGLPSLGRGAAAAWEPRGLALRPQRRGEDLPAHQLHDQRLPGRVHPHRVSVRAGRRRGGAEASVGGAG